MPNIFKSEPTTIFHNTHFYLTNRIYIYANTIVFLK